MYLVHHEFLQVVYSSVEHAQRYLDVTDDFVLEYHRSPTA